MKTNNNRNRTNAVVMGALATLAALLPVVPLGTAQEQCETHEATMPAPGTEIDVTDCLPVEDGVPVDADGGLGGQTGAGSGSASCDLLATACAAAVAAVQHVEVEATGMIPLLGEGSITLSADFGVAAAAMATRIVVSGTRNGETSVTSHLEEERVIKGDDKCQWYNPADWAGHCDPDQTVIDEVEKVAANDCPQINDIFTTPGDAGDWKANGCESNVAEGALCMEAEASATAHSDSPTGKEQVGASASNCNDEAAAAQFAQALEFVSTQSPQSPGSSQEMPIEELPEAAVDLLRAELRRGLEAAIERAMTNYVGPEETRDGVRHMLTATIESSLQTLEGTVIAYVTEATSE